VVDRTIETGKMKSRAVIYFRDINAAVIPDIYRMPSKAEIIANWRDVHTSRLWTQPPCFINGQLPGLQWFKGVIMHRGQEYFYVCPMGFINRLPQIQRQVDDLIFKSMRPFLCIYLDDFILRNIRLTNTTTFLGFPTTGHL
jgi:hypothetical protein